MSSIGAIKDIKSSVNLDQSADTAPAAAGNDSAGFAQHLSENLSPRAQGNSAHSSVLGSGLADRSTQQISPAPTAAEDFLSELPPELIQMIAGYVIVSDEGARNMLKTCKLLAKNIMELQYSAIPELLKKLEITITKFAFVNAAEFHDIMGREVIYARKGNQSEFQKNLDYVRHIATAVGRVKFNAEDDQQNIHALLGVDLTKFDKEKIRTNFGTQTTRVKRIEECLQSGGANLNWTKGYHLFTLPPQIGQLTNLTTLDLARNQLITLPPEIGLLTKLTDLNLLCNQLFTLPPQIGQLTNLTRLILGYNEFCTFPAAILLLTNLTWLELNHNQLITLPANIGQLKNLIGLNLSENKLTKLPADLGQLTNLQMIPLQHNQLITLPAEIGQLKNLDRLCLAGNQLTTLPAEIWQLTNLKKLDLQRNNLITLPPEIGQLTNLTWLELNHNQLITLPPVIGQLTNLDCLDLRNNQFTFDTPFMINLRLLSLLRRQRT